ncbi:MAG: hypothetical protein C4537_03620 [Acholeplasma sp.]|jgi:hypothetical protein|nr:MAG: hypothetical protein C4537_03620 [Acholeplasma sp.]
MSLKHEFAKPILKNDLMPVLRSGFFMSFTGGLILGLIHFIFTYYFSFSIIWLLLLVLSHLMATRIKQSYQTYHILYPLLSVLFFLFAYYLMNVTMGVGIYIILNLVSLENILLILIPFQYFRFLLPISAYFFSVNNLLQIVFFIIGIVYAYRYSR